MKRFLMAALAAVGLVAVAATPALVKKMKNAPVGIEAIRSRTAAAKAN